MKKIALFVAIIPLIFAACYFHSIWEEWYGKAGFISSIVMAFADFLWLVILLTEEKP